MTRGAGGGQSHTSFTAAKTGTHRASPCLFRGGGDLIFLGLCGPLPLRRAAMGVEAGQDLGIMAQALSGSLGINARSSCPAGEGVALIVDSDVQHSGQRLQRRYSR